jgi:hypothetical protein
VHLGRGSRWRAGPPAETGAVQHARDGDDLKLFHACSLMREPPSTSTLQKLSRKSLK